MSKLPIITACIHVTITKHCNNSSLELCFIVDAMIRLCVLILHVVAMATQAVATRDAMAKALYGALFDWIVDQVDCITIFGQ